MSGATIIELDSSNTCEICDNALAKYTCPKCQIKYCSLNCYQKEAHLECSEEFYKNAVLEKLSEEKNPDSRQKMIDILKRQMENNDELDSDDEDINDIADRLAGVDLDNADDIWEKLTGDEQQEFVAFLKSEDVTKLIPSWTPWWDYTTRSVEDLEFFQQYKKKCPQIVKIKDFKEISKKQPAGCVKYNLINILAGYVFTARYFNGEQHDFCKEVITCIITISQGLKNNENFEDYETAVKSVEFRCVESDWILADGENFRLLREDLEKILKGPNISESNFYVLCALSDLHTLLNLSLRTNSRKSSVFSKNFPNDHFPEVKLESKNKIKSCLKKIEYLLSFAKDFTL